MNDELHPEGLHRATTAWLAWSTLYMSTLSVLFLVYPELLENTAYELAERIMRFRLWAVAAGLSAFLTGWAALRGAARPAIFGLAIGAQITFIFGLSIMALTFEGSLAAMAGSITWWTPTAVYVWFLKEGL